MELQHELLQLSDFISVLETVLTIVAAFIGAAVHEYIFSKNNIPVYKNPYIWITVSIDFIICYSINPYIIAINPRLVLLPPLIIGLLGNELAIRLGTIKGSSSLIEYILGFFKIKNDNENTNNLGIEEIDIEDRLNLSQRNNNSNNNTNSTEIEQLKTEINKLTDDINTIIHDYYEESKVIEFLDSYTLIKIRIANCLLLLQNYQFIPINLTLKISEVIRLEMNLDNIYNEILSVVRVNNDNTNE